MMIQYHLYEGWLRSHARRIARLYRRGVPIPEITRTLQCEGIRNPNSSETRHFTMHVRTLLRKIGLLNPPSTCERWRQVLPPEFAEAQSHWDRNHHCREANLRGVAMQALAQHYECSRESIKRYIDYAELDLKRGRRPPIQIYLDHPFWQDGTRHPKTGAKVLGEPYQ